MAILTRFAAAAAMGGCMLLGTACSRPAESMKAAPVKEEKDRRPAPDFTLKDTDGRPVSLSDYKGKVVLLNFWATWCGPCKIEIPWFIEYEQKLKEKGFAVVGVSMDDDGWDAVRPFMKEHGVNYRMLMGNEMVAHQYGGVDALPTTFIIDREGRIASTHVGLVSRREYDNDIQALLSTP